MDGCCGWMGGSCGCWGFNGCGLELWRSWKEDCMDECVILLWARDCETELFCIVMVTAGGKAARVL